MSNVVFVQRPAMTGPSFSMWDLAVTDNGALAVTAKQVVGIKAPLAAAGADDYAKKVSFLRDQLALVNNYVELRDDRATEIGSQLGYPAPFWSSIVNLHPGRQPKTVELLDAAMRFCTVVEMRFKHALQCPRPVELSPQVQPMILTPGHGSYPSGHATESYMTATILLKLRGEAAKSATDVQLQRQAARIAINRTVAGVHFPVDSVAGRWLGTALADYFLARCNAGKGSTVGAPNTNYDARSYAPLPTESNNDFQWWDDLPAGTGQQTQAAESLKWLWAEAAREWL